MKWLAAEGREPPFDPQGQYVQGIIVRGGADHQAYKEQRLRDEHLVKALNVIVHGNPECVYVNTDDLLLELRNPRPGEQKADHWSVACLSMPSLLDGVKKSLGGHQQNHAARMRQTHIIDELFEELKVEANIRNLAGDS